MSEPEQWFWHDAEHQRGQHADADRGGRERAWPHDRRPVSSRLAEEHQHDDPDVREGQNGAAQYADHDQRHGTPSDRRLEYRELTDEATGQRYASEGDQEQREYPGDQWRALAEASPAGQVPGLASGVADQRDHGERADRREPVGSEIEHAARQPGRGGGDDAGQDV